MTIPRLEQNLIDKIRNALSDDLLKPNWKKQKKLIDPLSTNHKINYQVYGHCYIASEALYYLLGGKDSGYVPQVITVNNGTHWFLKNKQNDILDPTFDQFNFKINYSKSRGCGFLTKQPSKRTQQLLNKILANNKITIKNKP